MSREPMSQIDTAWLRMDRPGNLMQIVGVMVFDRPLDVHKLRDRVAARMLRFGRFRQCAIAHGTSYMWEDDPHFSLEHHIRRVELPAPGGKPQLEEFVADLASTPLNSARPLWEFHVVDSALVMRFHHCIADGIALVGLILSLMDDMPDVPPHTSNKHRDHVEHEKHDAPWWWKLAYQPAADALLTSIRWSGKFWVKATGWTLNPQQAVEDSHFASGVASELAYLASMPNDSRTRFKGEASGGKAVAWCDPIPLPEIKAVGKVLGCSVNDMLLASAAGALRHYLETRGDEVDNVEVRSLVPVNLRTGKEADPLGNYFGLVALELPVGIENPLARLYATRERMEKLKHSYQPAAALLLLKAVGVLPKAVQQQVLDLLANKASAVMTNVPGPQEAHYLAGAKLLQPMFWVPQSGDIGMGVSILSYNNQVQFGLITDSARVPDPAAIASRFRTEFEKLLWLVLMEPWENLGDPEAVEREIRGVSANA